MSVDRLPRAQKSSDKALARRSALTKVTWALDHRAELAVLKNGLRYYELARSLKEKIDSGEELQKWQYQDADTCYEMTMKALGLPFVAKKFDRPRGNLRHPK